MMDWKRTKKDSDREQRVKRVENARKSNAPLKNLLVSYNIPESEARKTINTAKASAELSAKQKLRTGAPRDACTQGPPAMSSSADVAFAPLRKISSSADERSPLYNDNLLLGDESSEGQTNPHNNNPDHDDGQDSPEVTSCDGEREPSQIKNGDELG